MKKLLYLFFVIVFSSVSAQENKEFRLSSHILDITVGKPVENVDVKLEKYNETTKQWVSVINKKTDKNGRIGDFLPKNKDSKSNYGKYKLIFFTEDYFKNKNMESFYPFIEVVFQIQDNQHYHVPITLSPFGYSTYRGS
ncbi:hydroxyisourate hydrolase [Chryseobacterium piscium]|uniref:5-hydroxyisourate hydrolase n=2 Tax=Chryseobacterium TaxID=59732 RepID=A0A3D9BTD1_9FLAO|nr:hydroxyisourate hydrolase [Chryseobacterium piscium]REC56779.1 hydroxyisourate hydrolase [Chryseobacterium piscium]